MSKLHDLCERPVAWLRSPGQHRGVVVSTRIRLARNSALHPFPRKLSRSRQPELVDAFLERIGVAIAWDDALIMPMAGLTETERLALTERQLISRELASGKRPSALYASADERVALMINEEDHLRLQVITSGLALAANLAEAQRIDQTLEGHLTWAFHPRFGYLSSCPTNAGTGMRASVMLHLPALAETQDLRQALRGLSKLNMTVRGLHGEGSEASGHFYQISNQRSLGSSEAEIASLLEEAVGRIIEYEHLARASLLSQGRAKLEDKVWRALGLLTHARALAFDELIDQLSWIRLGVSMDLLPLQDWTILDRILAHCQPAHLQLRHGERAATPEQRDRLRAELVRTWLAG